jgi:hypothetical protein
VKAFISEARAAGAFEVWVITNQSNAADMAMYAACGLRRENPDVMLALPLTTLLPSTRWNVRSARADGHRGRGSTRRGGLAAPAMAP